ncbi:MAG: DUF3109 family protein [Bacteroidales bacterium]
MSPMFEVGKTIVSKELFDVMFSCDLGKCKGACCIEGVSGAPVSEDEALSIEEVYPTMKKYLPEEHNKAIEKQGTTVIDNDGDLVTPLVNNKQCVYAYYDDDKILWCAIEKAYRKGEISFRKPASCYLYPVRITEYKEFDAVNYEKNPICSDALLCGKKNGVKVYEFLKTPLIEKYGKEWYEELKEIDKAISIEQ